MLAEIALWWAAQMRELLPDALLPARIRQPNTAPDARIVALDPLRDMPQGGQLTGSILLRRGGLETPIGVLDLDRPRPTAEPRLATGLRLPPDAVLSREVVLPLAAARNLQAVIGFEIDRLTPFAAQEVFWGIGSLRQDRARGRLSLNLFFVLRAQVDSARQALARIGLIPSFIESAAGRIELDAARPAIRWTRSGVPVFCGILALGCLLSPFLRQQLALDSAARRIAAASPAAQTALGLRQQLAIAASGQAAIAEARRAGDALQVLASLTDALPDGTWLSDLELKSGDLTFDGRSANAAALIGRLSAVPGLQDPSFTAPVTRTADGTADVFSIHATVQE
jgi:general secretion pathway protein L